MPSKIQKALDVVHVVGNNAVHPGSLDMKDNIETASKLFDLVNLIAEVMISQPKHVEAMYDHSFLTEQKRQFRSVMEPDKSINFAPSALDAAKLRRLLRC